MAQRPTINDDIERVLISEAEIRNRINDLGRQIMSDYADACDAGEDVVLVGLLRGAAIFMADLARAIKMPVLMDYMSVSSYGNSAESSGIVRIKKDVSEDLEGRHVIIVEDIFDTGLTLKSVRENFLSRDPLSVQIATLLRKNVAGQANVDCRYVGFECPDEFIVGYGLDYAERYRNLSDICVLKPEVYKS